MNSCCVLPLETIAANQHKTNGECCLVTEKTDAPARAECPVSKTSSRKVQRRTMEHLLKPEKVSLMQGAQYYYCAQAECPIVYFSHDTTLLFTVDDVAVKVFAKDPGDDVNVCYCFGWTRDRIKQEVENTGKSTAALQIAREVKAGTCECDIKNPKGECCLGDVNRVVREFQPSEG